MSKDGSASRSTDLAFTIAGFADYQVPAVFQFYQLKHRTIEPVRPGLDGGDSWQSWHAFSHFRRHILSAKRKQGPLATLPIEYHVQELLSRQRRQVLLADVGAQEGPSRCPQQAKLYGVIRSVAELEVRTAPDESKLQHGTASHA